MRVANGVILLVAGCSGAGGAGAPPVNAGPLGDGVQLAAALEIPAGMTVTIPPGARIAAAPGVTITVSGVLSIAAATNHARIGTSGTPTDATQDWGGIVVATGGQLDADGLDLSNAATALELQGGSLPSRYDDGTISDAQLAFKIDTGGRLDTAHAGVTNAGMASAISGEFHASYLDYETSGLSGGLITSDPSAVFDVTDSTFHGTMVGGGDYITSYASALVHVAYSTINDAHCAFHFDDVTQFQIDHVTAGMKAGMPGVWVVYGAMLYGSEAGPNTISNSNFMGEYALDQANTNGPLTITNTYTMGQNAVGATWTWAAADMATAPIPDAHPR
jgi:hypothetical protein